MSGFLGGLGLENVEAATAGLDAGTYPCNITKSEIVTPQGKEPAWVITYQVEQGSPSGAGKTHAEWWNNYQNMTEKAQGYLKRRLLQFRIPEAQFASLQPADIVGTPVWLTLYKNTAGYMAVGGVKLRSVGNVNNPAADPNFNDRTNTYDAVATATPAQFQAPVASAPATTGNPLAGL